MMIARKLLTAIATICTLSACATPAPEAFNKPWQSSLDQEHPLTGQIINLHTYQRISHHQLLDAARSTDVFMIGEKHDNADHHQIEHWLLQHLSDKNTRVVFEMLDDRQKEVLPQLSNPTSLPELKAALHWPAKGWNWEDYGPLFFTALQQEADLSAGNLSPERTMRLHQQGFSHPDDKPLITSVNKINSDARAAIATLVDASHCGMLPQSMIPNITDVQLGRDASMALSISTSRKEHTILIAGATHTRKDIGVPAHLAISQPQKKMVILKLQEVENGQYSVQDYSSTTKQVDFMWFTPRHSDRDYCDDLKNHKVTKKTK